MGNRDESRSTRAYERAQEIIDQALVLALTPGELSDEQYDDMLDLWQQALELIATRRLSHERNAELVEAVLAPLPIAEEED